VRLALVSPPQAHEGGNTTTVRRWERILRELGHERVAPEQAERLIALHAVKSRAAIEAFPGPVIVAATGTDLYPPSEVAADSFRRAWRVVVLEPRAIDALPPEVRGRARVIRQSVEPLDPLPPKDEPWTVAIVGHLRPVKDPLVVARAVGLLPASSRIRAVQVGAALTPELEAAARAAEGPRWRWLGAVPRDRALDVIARAHLLAVPSVTEGGANVVGEAVAHRTPPVATRIPGNTGLLGEDWPALFEVGDAPGLAALLDRWERDPALRADLVTRTDALGPGFAPARERAAWEALLGES
jgi:glycosyltransferase involved in cell wall biosynthesis